jgi:hypothetical protein
VEAVCAEGVMTALSNGQEWQIRERGGADHRGRSVLVQGEFPTFEPKSSTQGLIEDPVHALDTGEPTQGGVRLARANMELIFAFCRVTCSRRGQGGTAAGGEQTQTAARSGTAAAVIREVMADAGGMLLLSHETGSLRCRR